jgi:hypothetical protein
MLKMNPCSQFLKSVEKRFIVTVAVFLVCNLHTLSILCDVIALFTVKSCLLTSGQAQVGREIPPVHCYAF